MDTHIATRGHQDGIHGAAGAALRAIVRSGGGEVLKQNASRETRPYGRAGMGKMNRPAEVFSTNCLRNRPNESCRTNHFFIVGPGASRN